LDFFQELSCIDLQACRVLGIGWKRLAPRLRRNAALPGTRGRGPSSLLTSILDHLWLAVAFSATYSWELLAPAFRSVPFVSHGNCRSIPWDLTRVFFAGRENNQLRGPLNSQPLLSVPYFRTLALIRSKWLLPNFTSRGSPLESYRSSSALTGMVVKSYNQCTQLTGNAQSLSRSLCRNICASSNLMCGVLKIGVWPQSCGLQPVRAGGPSSGAT
jgi:hypothetical protein